MESSRRRHNADMFLRHDDGQVRQPMRTMPIVNTKEPSLEDVLRDPVIRALMRSDGITAEQIRALRHVARTFRQRRRRRSSR